MGNTVYRFLIPVATSTFQESRGNPGLGRFNLLAGGVELKHLEVHMGNTGINGSK